MTMERVMILSSVTLSTVRLLEAHTGSVVCGPVPSEVRPNYSFFYTFPVAVLRTPIWGCLMYIKVTFRFCSAWLGAGILHLDSYFGFSHVYRVS
ncbi:hypothetical protein QBC45DRAFT_105155 [Copromyces sp. CBS 386.78]|nr:hypothetical protein QBC45DRAFT_105155 [Copromyces sp. CBS 386.78]